jgi:hypothetical protein
LRTKHRSRRGAIAERIRKTIFQTFGESQLPKITTKASADAVKRWKDSSKVQEVYRKLNDPISREDDETWGSRILRRSWNERPNNEQMAFSIAVIVYILNPRIYTMRIKDEDIRKLMEKIKVSIFNLNYFHSNNIIYYLIN